MSFKRITAATLISMAILSGCATTATTTASEPEHQVKIAQADERVLGYFSADGEFGQEKSGNGYIRKYLGKTAEGKSVLQDFYAINGKPQTSPFVLFDDAGLEDWNSLQYTEGDIVFYNADGTVSARATLKEGQYVGSNTQYHGNGKVFLKEQYNPDSEITATSYFDEAGKPLFAFTIDSTGDDYKIDVKVYDEAGTAYPATEAHDDKIQAATANIAALMNKRAALEAKLAGQETPEEQAIILPTMPEE